MKKNYEELELEVLHFGTEDVLTTSADYGVDPGQDDQDWGLSQ